MRPDRTRGGGFVVLVLVAAIAPAWSAPPELDNLLARLPPGPQAQLQEHWQQWSAWSPQQREAYTRRANEWDALPREVRASRRERYQAWQALPPLEQANVRAAGAQFATMPVERQQAWRAQFEAMDRSQRRGWLLGPVLGVDYAALQPLLAQVPEQEHEPLMQALRSMTPQQRSDLGVLAQRTPPAQREALRRGLLAAGIEGRAEWLWRQLQH